MTILESLLSGCFALAWAVAAFNPQAGAVLLAGACSILTLPHFMVQFGTRIVQNTLVAAGLMVMGTFVPLVWPLVAIWTLVCIVTKLRRFGASLPLILLGVAVYGVTLVLPSTALHVGTEIATAAPPVLLAAVIGLLGGVGFHLLVRLTVALGSTATRSAALMLGFTSYLFLFVLTFFLPHADGGDA